MQSNSAVLDKEAGIIEICVAGPQTGESIDELARQAERAGDEASVKFGRVCTMADASEMEGVSLDIEKAAVRALKVISFDRLAVVVKKQPLRQALEAMVKLSGKGDIVHFYDDQTAARNWLKED
jgi:hypothetical protein